ncbi:MAG: sulfatase [Candidatus Eisenbacteria bacterium]
MRSRLRNHLRGSAGAGSVIARREAGAKVRKATALLGILLLVIACGRTADRPNVVIIAVDTLRPDHLGCYGYVRNTSPNIDRLAGEGVLFERAVSQAPWTTPSFATIFTSLYPTQHGAKGFSNRMRTDFPTLGTLLEKAGYATAAIVNAPSLSRAYGVDRGFGVYALASDEIRAADQTTRDALAWIDLNKNRPFLTFVHYFDPHMPYAPPAPYDTTFDPHYQGPLHNSFDFDGFSLERSKLFEELKRLSAADWNHIRSLYDGEIAFTDRAVGDLLAGLRQRGLGSGTLIVFLSDHGEEFFEHGGFEHGHCLYDEVIRVPLVFSLPGVIPKNVRLSEQVRLIDVAPTILDVAGLERPADFEGTSLMPLLLGKGHDKSRRHGTLPPEVAYSEAVIYEREKKSVVVDGWKLIYDAVTEEMQMFNLVDDPGETRNLVATELETLGSLERYLFQALLGTSDSWYIEIAGGLQDHAFDLTLGPGRGPLVGNIHPYRFFDANGHVVNVGAAASEQDGIMRIEGLHLGAPLKLAFKVEPEDMPIKFDLRVDGKPAIGQTFLGRSLARPEEMPFTQVPRRERGKSQGVPSKRPSPPYLLIWHTQSPCTGETAMRLDERTKKELRAVGYIQ